MSQEQMVKEKANENVYVSLDIVWQDSYRKHDARLSEMSMTGGHIDCLAQGGVGEIFGFKLRLPSGHWVSLEGEVTYSDYPQGFGFKFTELSPANRKLIAEVVVSKGGTYAQKYLEQENEKPAKKELGKILVADDDPMTLRMLKVIIGSYDYKVVTAEDGREAFRVLQKEDDFSAAILDMMMPHLDGLDLIQYMKTDDRLRKIPVGMITAEHDPKIWDESVAAGAKVFLPKPFNPQQLKMLLNMLIA